MPTARAHTTNQHAESKPFDWKGANARWTPSLSETFAQERGLNPLVFEQLRDRGYIGYCLCGKFGQRCFAVPFRDADGTVFRAQCRAPKRDQNGHTTWAYEPSSDPLERRIPPYIVGQLGATRVFVSESHMDLIALIDRGGFIPDIDDELVAFISTCGASGTGKLADLGWPEDVEIFLVPQTDEPGQRWLDKVLHILSGFEPRVLIVPPPYKDFGEWAKAGLTQDELLDRIEAAAKGEAPPEPEGKRTQSSRQNPPEEGGEIPPPRGDFGPQGRGNVGKFPQPEPFFGAHSRGDSSVSSLSSGGICQEAVFPPESILADYYAYAITQTEGADAYIVGAILPVTAAILARNVWMPWPGYQGKLYPNIYAILAGPPGNLKSTSIYPAEAIAVAVLGKTRFLAHNYSPEGLFDSFFQNPDRPLTASDAGSTITKWANPYDGERLSHSFLTLYDGEPMSEDFRRNRQNNNLNTQARETGPTSLSILFGSTLSKCQFGNNNERDGLQRRFNYYLAIDKVRELNRPRPDPDWLQELVEKFKRLTFLKGPFTWESSAEQRFDGYKKEVQARLKDCDPFDESTRGRLSTLCAMTVKVAMLFESARICMYDPQTIPSGPPLVIRKGILELAIEHVEACFQASQLLADVANQKVIRESAETLLASIRSEFAKFKHPHDPNAIVLTRTQLTHKYAHNPNRRGGFKVDDLYKRIIPYLIRIGDAKLIAKDGKKETYAFRVE